MELGWGILGVLLGSRMLRWKEPGAVFASAGPGDASLGCYAFPRGG
jgi:hypothetical protein